MTNVRYAQAAMLLILVAGATDVSADSYHWMAAQGEWKNSAAWDHPYYFPGYTDDRMFIDRDGGGSCSVVFAQNEVDIKDQVTVQKGNHVTQGLSDLHITHDLRLGIRGTQYPLCSGRKRAHSAFLLNMKYSGDSIPGTVY